MKLFVYTIAAASMFVACTNSDAKQDAQKMAELFCKQNTIVTQAKDLTDSLVLKQLEEIEEEANKINKEIESKYAKDTKAMETFAKTYQEYILQCK
ncbi:MAG TPA: hypothetical protein PK199_09510 [Bacteroidales bacterium]|nr:hypothetical protein [Bacteroidales bacterium]